MTLPKWFSYPNDLMTVEDIQEMLEYERAQLEMIESEHEVSEGEERYRLHLDRVNTKLRIAQLEDSL